MCLHFTTHRTVSTMLSHEILNPSMSIENESIESTQSLEYVFETETQEDLPETQESTSSFTTPGLHTDFEEIDEQYPVTWDSDKRCVNCGNIATANPFLQRRKVDIMCASCVHYEHYLYDVVQRGRRKSVTTPLVEVQSRIPSPISAFKEFEAKEDLSIAFDNIHDHDRKVFLHSLHICSPYVHYQACE